MKANEKKCGPCEIPAFERNNYFYGKQFTVRDLVQEQRYLNEKRWLINRMVLGWGVVCGLDVKWDPGNEVFLVSPGLALGPCGQEILVCDEQRVHFEPWEHICGCYETQPDYRPEEYVLCLEYRECKTEQVELPPVNCECDARAEYNRIREGFHFKIKKRDDACLKPPFGDLACLDRFKSDVSADPPSPRPCSTGPIHHYLCHRLKECPESECCECVVLATINVRKQADHPDEQDSGTEYRHGGHAGHGHKPTVLVDTCTWRRLVYRNPLLYDLIHCHHGDLPHIVDFSWRSITYPDHEASWDEFVHMIRDGLTLYFDQPMEPSSLNPSTFIVSFLHKEQGVGHFVEKRIPAKAIRYAVLHGCPSATFIADEDWAKDELEGRNSQLAGGVDVEIVARGNQIRSVKGPLLDAENPGNKLPTGNGTQGGEFLYAFRVGARGAPYSAAKKFDNY